MGEVEVEALKPTDLDVAEGEALVILGPSGSGKSTLLHLLGGVDRPSAGTILFRDLDLTGLDAKGLTLFRRRHVGFVFQFYNLIPSLTALENVAMATEVAPNPRDPRAMIGMVGLADRADHFPAQLSGGEQQRVAIARAVAKAPDVLLCDEPTGALDYRTGIKVLEVLRQVNRELGTTLLLITHNAAIADIADRVVRMRSGRILETRVNEAPKAPEAIEW
ncbi:MAG TPA: ABC transporter ATP-binding protein [Planctomycetota bacterium]|nr:ABC transporter ATP-binding protein [Planctomycetota bacterium]